MKQPPIIKRLLSYQKSPEAVDGDDKWPEKVVKSLVQKLKKTRLSLCVCVLMRLASIPWSMCVQGQMKSGGNVELALVTEKTCTVR